MFHCSSGKDRTGLVAALLLGCVGVDNQDIIQNYRISEDFLSPVCLHFPVVFKCQFCVSLLFESSSLNVALLFLLFL